MGFFENFKLLYAKPREMKVIGDTVEYRELRKCSTGIEVPGYTVELPLRLRLSWDKPFRSEPIPPEKQIEILAELKEMLELKGYRVKVEVEEEE